jgi:Arc/MetJ-type ribon-helix-helix transcriptional regulator
MTTRIKLRLNQQQLELIDKTVKEGEAADRAELVRRALKEFVQARPTSPAAGE